MSWQIGELLRTTPRFTKRDVWLIPLPFVLWAALLFARPFGFKPLCVESPQSCTPESVFFLDRATVEFGNRKADSWSFITQDGAALSTLLIPLAWDIGQIGLKRLTPTGAMISLVTDLTLLLKSTAWNGVSIEIVRRIVQRPRPFVYQDPQSHGALPAHYTSFYSGHTSFAALAAVCLVAALLRRGASRRWIIGAACIGIPLVFLTGLFRVLSGRHFPSDVLAAPLFGVTVAFLVVRAWAARTLASGLLSSPRDDASSPQGLRNHR